MHVFESMPSITIVVDSYTGNRHVNEAAFMHTYLCIHAIVSLWKELSYQLWGCYITVTLHVFHHKVVFKIVFWLVAPEITDYKHTHYDGSDEVHQQ